MGAFTHHTYGHGISISNDNTMSKISEIDCNVTLNTFQIMHVLERSLKWLFGIRNAASGTPFSCNTIFFFA